MIRPDMHQTDDEIVRRETELGRKWYEEASRKMRESDTLARGIVRKPPPRTWGLHRYAMLAAAFALGAMLAHVGPKAYQQFQLDSVEYVR